MKTRSLALCAAAAFAAAALVYSNIQRNHTFTLSGDQGAARSEQIQPLLGTVRVSGNADTRVVFTDVETDEQYIIGYITHGLTEKIRLKRGKWYRVEGSGDLTLRPVRVKAEEPLKNELAEDG